jgi:outer membrane protein assembly factor BamD
VALDAAGVRMTRMTKTFRFTAVLALAALIGACASGGPKKPPTGTPDPDKFLFDRGTENLDKHRWIVAREYFRQLVDSYPQSPYRADAKLGIGDTYIGDRSAESYVLAINEFREFLNFYPTNRRAHYAQYKLAMAHFYQMKDPMRDQTETRDAIKELQAYVTRYPNEDLIGDARTHLREARDRLDTWEVGVAEHYYRIKWYPGAIGRLAPMLKSDPEYSRRDKAYFILAGSYEKVQRPAEALPIYERLVKEFEQSEYLELAKKRIADIKATLPAAETGKGVAKGASS